MKTTTEQTEALDQLREMLPPGSEVKTILRHVSASGMTRWISPVIDGEDYSWLVARALGVPYGRDNHEGIKRVGAGMDMGFDLVYSLSRALYPRGFACVGERCGASIHSNQPGTIEAFHAVDGGYALKQRWL